MILTINPAPDRPVQHPPVQQDEYLCWTRMQAEAGQALDLIVGRKERERRAGNGLFFWGVGNAPGGVANVLARTGNPVRAVFSVMKSRPKAIDVAPRRTVVWRRYMDANGIERVLPPHALVTSRGDSAGGAKRIHHALMCTSSEPLMLRYGERFDPAAFRNAGGTGAPVGFSQVTAMLRRVNADGDASDYETNLSAWLTGGYWVRLTDPLELDAQKLDGLADLENVEAAKWCAAVAAIRRGPPDEENVVRGTGLLI